LIKQNKLRRNENTKEDIVKIIQYEKVSLKSKIRIVLRSLMDKVCIKFSEIFLGKGSTRLDIITGFMAILELAKINKIELYQEELFSEIEIRRKDLSDENIDMIPEENNGV
jgi:segregation and condensation protein A